MGTPYTGFYDLRSRPADSVAALLGLQFVSSAAGADCAQPAGRTRHLRGHADGRGQVFLLPVASTRIGTTTVVISPLIALMQDQAAQLAQMGIPAAVLNSSISSEEQTRIMRQAREGAFRLLYLSPERLQRADTLSWLQQVPISFFAIDEAHCISEWGHEFRPEYRQLSSLRGKFPDRPIAAFTASATRHVRHDILTQLQLRNPDKYIASFHRPNLRYLVRECNSVEHTALLVTALRHYGEGNVIVYSPTINKVEETVGLFGRPWDRRNRISRQDGCGRTPP